MSIASEITRLQNAKSALKTSINAKTDSSHQIDDETLDEYSDFVDSIQTGGGGGSMNQLRVDVEYGEATGYEYVLKTTWSEIQAFIDNPSSKDRVVLYDTNSYITDIWEIGNGSQEINSIRFVKYSFEGNSDSSNGNLMIYIYDISENSVVQYTQCVRTEEY